MKMIKLPAIAISIITILSLLGGCSSQGKIEKYLSQGNDFFDSYKYNEAEITYLNVLKIDEKNSVAREKLATISFNRGQYQQAYFTFKELTEENPSNEKLHIDFANCLLVLSLRGEARSIALSNFEKFPENPDTALSLSETADTPEQIAESKKILSEAIDNIGDKPEYRIALGLLELKSNNREAAENQYSKAEFQDREAPATLSALGTYYWVTQNIEQAEHAFQKASTMAAPYSPRRLLLARFKQNTAQPDQAIALAKTIESETPDNIPTLQLLANLHAATDDLETALNYADKVLKLNAYSIESLILKGRIFHQQKQFEKADTSFSTLIKAYPAFPEGYALKAQTQLALENENDALDTLKQALENNAKSPQVLKQLADIQAKRKRYVDAISTLQQLLEIDPKSPQAWFALAQLQQTLGENDKALITYEQISEIFPNDPQSKYQIGLIQLQLNQIDSAEKSFTESLERDPQFPPSIEKLARIDFSREKYPEALERVNKSLEAAPQSAPLHYLKATILTQLGQSDNAAQSLKSAIKIDPNNAQARHAYAISLAQKGEIDSAIEELQTTVKLAPNSFQTITTLANLYESKGDYTEAEKQYRSILEKEPNSPIALNNLAFIYSEYLDKNAEALKLAQKARELVPGNPMISDTLGWIAYKTGDYPWAYNLLSEAYKQYPELPDISYHLGATAYKLGYEAEALPLLEFAKEKALKEDLINELGFKIELLKIDSEDPSEKNITFLQKALEDSPSDPVALNKLARLFVLNDQPADASELLDRILDQTPNNQQALILKVDMLEKTGQIDKAFTLAQKNFKNDETKQETIHQLGRIAYQKGDYTWSFSLLNKAFKQQPDHNELAYDFAKSAYAIGEFETAQNALNNEEFEHFEDINQLKKMIQIFLSQTISSSNTEAARSAFDSAPDDAPSLMAYAKTLELEGTNTKALELFQKAYDSNPNLISALSRIVRITARSQSADKALYEKARSVSRANTENHELAQSLACLAYISGDFTRSSQLFENSKNFVTADAEALYFWGMSQLELEQSESAKAHLQKAIEQDLQDPFLSEAQSALARLQ